MPGKASSYGTRTPASLSATQSAAARSVDGVGYRDHCQTQSAVAAALAPGTVGRWDPSTGQQIGETWETHAEPITSVSMGSSADGDLLLATGSDDEKVRLRRGDNQMQVGTDLTSDSDPRIAEEQLREEIKRTVAPELLNRLDGTLVFRPLEPSVIRKIARKNINEALSRVSGRGIMADITDEIEDVVCEEGFSPEYGARPLQRAVERLVIRPLIGLPPGRYMLEYGDGSTVAHPLADSSR